MDQLVHQRYRVERTLGSGGLGVTFLATDLLFQVPIALKLLQAREHHDLAAFQREFSLLHGLSHPHLNEVFDYGLHRASPSVTQPFFTASFVDGTSLTDYGRSHEWPAILEALAGPLHALHFLHRAGIRHGDIKPDNILVEPSARGVLIDLSCSQSMNAPGQGVALTSGTPGFLPPELGEGAVLDARADIFAVGVTLETIAASCPAPLPASLRRSITRLKSPLRNRPTSVPEVLTLLGLETESEHLFPVGSTTLVARHSEQTRFIAWLQKRFHREPSPALMQILGPNGVGRTRLLHDFKWMAQLEEQPNVLEGWAARDGCVAEMLTRATGHRVESGIRSVLRARERLAKSKRPWLFVLDDIHQLSDADATLLRAIVRATHSIDGLAVVASGRQPLLDGEDQLVLLELTPWSVKEVERWLGQRFSGLDARELHRLSGGFPKELSELFAGLRSGALGLTDLRKGGSREAIAKRSLGLSSLSKPARRALIRMAAAEAGPLGALVENPFLLPTLAEPIQSELILRGHLRRAERSLHLSRPAARILAAASTQERRRGHEDVAAHCDSIADGPPEVRGAEIYHLAEAGMGSRAEQLACETLDLAQGNPRAFASGWAALLPHTDRVELWLRGAKVLLLAGHADDCLTWLAKARRANARDTSGAGQNLRAEIHAVAGAATIKLGRTRRALSHLRKARELDKRQGARAAIDSELSHALIKVGNHRDALLVASDALDRTSSEPNVTLAELHFAVGFAGAYLGEFPLAREHLQQATELHQKLGQPRSVARSHAVRAFVEYRAGSPQAAAEAYEKALETAKRAGLPDLETSYGLNHGVACHQLGDWGRALQRYDEIRPLAVGLGLRQVEATLEFNLAKLRMEIGQLDLARTHAKRALALCEQAGLSFLGGAVLSVKGELELLNQQHEVAFETLERAHDTFESNDAPREAVEVKLLQTRIKREAGDLEAARAILDRLRESPHVADVSDLQARLGVQIGLLEIEQGNAKQANETLERALRLAASSSERTLQAEIEQALSRAADGCGTPFLAVQHQNRARELWERTLATLPPQLHDVFWHHPVRRTLRTASPIVATTPSDDSKSLRRLLAINQRLNSSLDVEQILEWTMDAAIELSGAERGFLITPKEGGKGFSVAVARNVDRERVGKSHLKFSQSIAERVVRTSKPVVTIDAGQDPRFHGNRSVHAMQLKAVCAVPILSPSGVLGAIYLDNRFRAGGFDEDNLEILGAFADQAALALRNARLYGELERKTRELEEQGARVQELLAGQTARAEQLSRELEAHRHVAKLRYDFSAIVGESAAMQRVFAQLDRVVDTPLTVVVEGESGTGKELVARAIHLNSDRANQPFLAINCAALPEQLLEAELFGHAKGAFTGADRDRTGLFVAATGGTLFLDELGELPSSVQAKLLRVLQERVVRPLGTSRSVGFDVRLVCATNRNLQGEVRAGRFREDLYFRLAVVRVVLPPLRERVEDIPLLASKLLPRLAEQMGKPTPTMTSEALRLLSRHPWPGNVRQLENVLLRATLMADENVIHAHYLDVEPHEARSRKRSTLSGAEEAAVLRRTLEETGWNMRRAAALFGVSRATFYRKLRRHGIERPDAVSED